MMGTSLSEFKKIYIYKTDGRLMALRKLLVASTIDIPAYPKANSFALIFDGLIEVPAEGIYTFYLYSDDGSQLQIGDRVVVNDDGYHSVREVSGQIALRMGQHPIKLKYFEGGGGGSLRLMYKGPGINKQVVPDVVLKRTKNVKPRP